jgi:DNA mismatch endonuclease, patch repair protein
MSASKYIRDGRAPIPKNEITSMIMSRIRAKNTSPELILRKAIRKVGLKAYKLHDKNLPGRPDISFSKIKLALFINGCYWHRCPYCKPGLPKSHISFWREKFKKNKVRDKQKTRKLHNIGWQVMTIWECQIKKDLSKAIARVKKAIHSIKNS